VTNRRTHTHDNSKYRASIGSRGKDDAVVSNHFTGVAGNAVAAVAATDVDTRREVASTAVRV